MSRRERRESPTGFYHVMQRGAGKQILFEDENDYKRYLEKLIECKAEIRFDIAAYCLMNNHVHLLLRVDNVEVLAQLMMKIGTSYAKWYNIKYAHAGYVFQGRYLSEPILDEEYFLACVRYIHNNPVKAGLGQRNEYRWSSYNEYFNTGKYADKGIIEDLFEDRDRFETFSESTDNKLFIDEEISAITCSIGQDIIRKHYGNEFENSLMVKQLCISERNRIIKEMKEAGLSNHQIELVTGVSREIVRRI